MPKRVGVTYRNEAKVEPYEKALRAVGIEPVRIDPESVQTLDELDGLVLTGGTDLNPALYGESPHPETDQPDDARDALEFRLLASALDRDLPVLAICRGMQLFNVAHGGALLQHVAIHRQPGIDDAHEVEVEAGTKLGKAIGPGAHPVNSRHHQVAGLIGSRLRVSARSEEGYPEGLERPDKKFAVAVQWHPEDLVDTHPDARKLFQAFADAL